MTAITSNTGASNLDTINTSASNIAAADQTKGGFAALGHADFLKLMVAQLQQQDPFAPVDNKDMLAQMAQFTALSGSNTTNDTLADISAKLDALIAVQKTAVAAPAADPASPATTTDLSN